MGRTASRGALIGGAAALLVALGDFGASWLWLPWWLDRVELLVRLVTVQVPLGALLGATLASVGHLSRRPTAAASRRLGRGDPARERRWSRRLWPLPFVALSAPGIATVAVLLFSGGKMSRLPAVPALVAVVAVALLLGLYATLRLARWVVERAADAPPRRARLAALAALGVHFLLAKADQHVLPNLYQYLHATLTVAAWLFACLGVLLAALHWPRARRLDRRRPRAGLVAAAVALGTLAVNLATLDDNQNVRVALFDARAASSRDVMLALEPLVRVSYDGAPATEAVRRAREARERRARASDVDGLPQLEGAHVLLVTIDALRADHLGYHGYERPVSPNLDALAAESIVFEMAYAQAPHSSYSLCSLMTSEYVHETLDLGLPLPEATLATTLGAAGYHTAAFFTLGIFHTEGDRMTRYRDNALGFERHEHRDVAAGPKTDEALLEVDRVIARGEPPSLLWVHYFDVHEPYEATHFGTRDLDRYDSEIREADREVGRLIREARDRLTRPLIVVVTADHGEEFRDHGGLYHGSTLFQEQVHVPLLVHLPGVPPTRVAAPVELVDVAPTLLGALDVPVPPSMRGDDLRPLAAGRVEDPAPAFSAVIYKRMVVRWPWKLIADLRFNLFQLYHLERDPREQENLADREPEQLQRLQGEVYAWLDSLQAAEQEDAVHVALRRGRLRDRRAVEPLSALILDEAADRETRREAGRILGRLADRRSADSLSAALDSPDALVAAEAAIALGRMFDERARPMLQTLVFSEDPDIRTRAAVSLGRLRDRAAVPALIEALWVAEERYEREEAIRWLGRLRDARAVEPLIGVLPEFRLRYLTVVALGQIGDPRAYDTLEQMLGWARHSNVRDNVARALGQMADPRAIPHLVQLAATESGLENVGESLIRLGAIEAGVIGGADVGPPLRRQPGFAACQEGPLFHDWDYLQRTSCDTSQPTVSIPIAVPPAVAEAPDGVVVILRLRRADGPDAAPIRLRIGERELGPVAVAGQWEEHRWDLEREDLAGPPAAVILQTDGEARFSVDHVLLVPHPPTVAAAHP